MESKTLTVPLIAGFAAHLFMVAIVVSLHIVFDVNSIKIWIGPIPFLSAFLSFIASLFFLVGLKESEMTRSGYIYISFGMLVSCIGGIGLIYFLEYQTTQLSNGQMISQILSFKDFLQIRFSSSSIRMVHQEASEALQLGRAGFLLPAMESLAYVVGGSWIGFAAIKS